MDTKHFGFLLLFCQESLLEQELTEFVTCEYLGFSRLAALANKLKLIYYMHVGHMIRKSSTHGDRRRDKLQGQMK